MTVGCRLRAGAASMARSASSDSLRATATRSYSGDVSAASISPNRRYTSASVRALPTGAALAAVGPGIATTLALAFSAEATGALSRSVDRVWNVYTLVAPNAGARERSLRGQTAHPLSTRRSASLMTLSTTFRRTVSLVALSAVAGSAGLAGSASAATIGAPEGQGPGARIPINFAAFKEPANNLLPKNHRIVRKHVELPRGEKASTVMTAPAGFKIVTVGLGNGNQVGGAVDDVHYSGKRSVRVRLFTNNRAVAKGQTGTGTVYILARRA